MLGTIKNNSSLKDFHKLTEPYRILYSLEEEEYDQITKLASTYCECPISLITFFDEKKQLFKSHHGLEVFETPLEESFCKHVIDKSDELLIINNAKKNQLFENNPWVKAEPGVVFYAGYPIRNREGVPFAVLCVIDYKARNLNEIQKETLKSLSFQVEQLLELRRSKYELETLNSSIKEKNKFLEDIIEGTEAGTWELEIQSGNIVINEKWYEILGYSSHSHDQITLDIWKKMIFPQDLNSFEKELKSCFLGGSDGFRLSYRMKNFQGDWIWVENRAKVVKRAIDGKPLKMFGVHLNVNKMEVLKKQFHTIAENIPGAIFRYGISNGGNHKLTYVSNQFLDLWGITGDEEREIKDVQSIWNLISEEDLPQVKKSIEQSAAHMTDWSSIWRVKLPDGSLKWHKGMGRPTRNPDGSIYWDAIILDITEEKEIAERLTQRNEFIEVILENLPIGIAVNDTVTGKATIVNDQFSEIYGWPQEEISDVSTFFENIYPEEDYRAKMIEQIISDIQSGDPEKMVWNGVRVTGKNGEFKIIDAKNIPIPSQNLMISTVLDNTDLYVSKNELIVKNDRFKYATQATSDVIWDYDLVNGEIHWGGNYELNFGQKPLKGLTNNISSWEKQVHPDDRQRVMASFKQAINGKESNWSSEYRFQKEDGEYLEILDKGFVVRDQAGTAIRMVGAMQDITAQKQREHQLKVFKSVLDNTADAIIITEAEPLEGPGQPKIIYVNQAFKKSTGYTNEEILGKTPEILQGPGSDQNAWHEVELDLKSKKKIVSDVLNYTKEGKEFWVNLSISPVSNDEGVHTHYISVRRDITEKKHRDFFENTLSSISNIFNLQLGLKDSLDHLLRVIAEYYQSNVAELWLLNLDKSQICLVANSVSDPHYNSFSKEGYNGKGYKKGVGLIGKVWDHKKVEHWRENDGGHILIRDKSAKQLGLKSVFGIPLLYKEEIVGVLALACDSKTNPENFNSSNLKELGVFLGTEVARKQIEEELDQLIAFAPGYICSLDDKGYFKRVNCRFDTFFDPNHRDLYQINLRDIAHPLDRPKVENIIKRIEKGLPVVSSEIRCLSKDNKIFWLSWNFSPVDELGISYGVGKDITQQKELEKLLDKATDLARIGLWEVDLIKKEVYWSQIAKDIHEVPSDYVPNIETAINFYKDEADRARMLKWIENAADNDEVLSHESQIITANGTVKWVKSVGEPVVLNGKVIKIYGSIEDIHQRKVAEIERIHILESIGDGFFAVDNNWVVNYWNHKAELILGVSKSEILGKNFWEVFSELMDSEFFRQGQLAGTQYKPVHYEAKYASKGIWLDVSAYPSKNKNGFTVYFKDITAKKDTIEQIKHSNERFSKIAQATQDAIWDWDIKSKTLFWGSGFKDRFGHEVLAENLNISIWSELVHPRDQKCFFNKISESLRDQNVMSFKNEYRFRKKNGKYAHVVDSVYILRGDGGKPLRLVGATQDVTDRIKYEQSLKKLNKELTVKAKLLETSNAELEQFAYVASHDLQEPLRMITGFLNLLENRYSNTIDDRGKKYIHMAVDGALRMRVIILELLEYSRVGNISEKIEELEIEALIEEVSFLHKKQIKERSAEIVTKNLPKIRGFKSPMRQIFLNLIGNSLKYCEGNKTPKIMVSCSEEKEFWKFSIKDNGIGINPAYFDKIFIVFQRLHNREEYSGSGMGLAITKKIVETLGGEIWVESNEGNGSNFMFTIKKIKK